MATRNPTFRERPMPPLDTGADTLSHRRDAARGRRRWGFVAGHERGHRVMARPATGLNFRGYARRSTPTQ